MPRSGYYIVLESESDVCSSSEDETESVMSIQSRITDFAKDSSDTSTKSSRSNSIDASIGLEYDVISLPENDQPPFFDINSTGTDAEGWKDQISVEVPQVSSGTGDDKPEHSLSADISSAGNDVVTCDPPQKIPIRPRTCTKCNGQTNFFQLCHYCFKARKSFFPPRPKGYSKKKMLRLSMRRKADTKLNSLSTPSDSKTDSLLNSGSSQELVPSGNTSAQGLCNICLVNPKNGAFVHCRWVHIYSCYQCSLRVLFTSRCCPLCNGKIRQVSKVAIC